MCNINLINQYASTSEFEDCNNDEGILHLLEGADDGENTTFTMSGSDTSGGAITGDIDVPNSSKVSPSKLFWFIAEKAKEILCPNCV